jgi:hypothetical protein
VSATEPEADDLEYLGGEDDGLNEDGNFKFECAAYWIPSSGKTKGYWHCPLAGTEECDWECKE